MIVDENAADTTPAEQVLVALADVIQPVVVTRIYTDLAVFHIVDGQMRLTECAPGVTPGTIRGQTAAPYAEDLGAEG